MNPAEPAPTGSGAPHIDVVTASYFRSGKCAACGGSTERSRSFTATTIEDCQRQATAWMATPLQHKRCERNPR